MEQKIKISKFMEVVEDGDKAYATCPAGDAARIIPPVIRFNKPDGTYTDYLLFVEEYRPPVGKNIYNFPGGRLNKGEDGLTAIVRELIEETGLEVDIKGVQMLSPSKPKDSQNSNEGESLFICPQIINVDQEETEFVEMLYKTQHLDETEECRIKLVDIAQIDDFMKNTDMCLPTRLALVEFLAMRDKSQITYPQYIPYYSTIGDMQYSDTVYQNKNFEVQKVDVGYDYCYYSPVKNHRFSLMITIEVEGKKYYAFEKIVPYSQNGEDVCTFPYIDVADPAKTSKTALAINVLQRYGLATRISGLESIAPYDAVSPGFTDLRQCVCHATIKLSKQDFATLAIHQKLTVVSQEELMQGKINTDYITTLATDADIQLDSNKQKQNIVVDTKQDESERV